MATKDSSNNLFIGNGLYKKFGAKIYNYIIIYNLI